MAMGTSPVRRMLGAAPQVGSFNSYAAGKKVYGGGRPNPNQGKTGAAGMLGYQQRDAQQEARKNALTKHLGGL